MNRSISVIEEENPPEQGPEQGINQFVVKLESISSIEERLTLGISFMREALAKEGTPDFRGFWEVRKICLPFFKDTLVAPLRVQLWADYIELTREGRRLKNMLDEEAAFAVEQIDLAITVLESEVKEFHERSEGFLLKIPRVSFVDRPKTIQSRYAFYEETQSSLNILNVYASRINSLRKELIKTEMRIRQKNKFFQTLSQLGDQVFPFRKELIQKISEGFMKDVGVFVSDNFSPETFSQERIRRSVFFFREEIKALQSIAKVLTLNAQAFSTTREELSHCWDSLKGMEKELKKEFAEQKVVSNENAEKIVARIKEFIDENAENNLAPEESLKALDALSFEMRGVELTRNDVRLVKEELKSAREPFEAELEKRAETRRLDEADLEQKRKDQIDSFQQSLEALRVSIPTGTIETLEAELEGYRKQLASLGVTKVEKQQLERSLKEIKDRIIERHQQLLLELSDDDRSALENLHNILAQRKEKRNEIKIQIEEYRKIIGGSNLDVEKSMHFNQLMLQEKERRLSIEQGILDVEKKIRDLKKKA